MPHVPRLARQVYDGWRIVTPKDRPGRKRVFKTEVSFPCPFCDLKIAVSYADEEPCATHPMPPCQGFVDTDLLDLLVIVRTVALAPFHEDQEAPS